MITETKNNNLTEDQQQAVKICLWTLVKNHINRHKHRQFNLRSLIEGDWSDSPIMYVYLRRLAQYGGDVEKTKAQTAKDLGRYLKSIIRSSKDNTFKELKEYRRLDYAWVGTADKSVAEELITTEVGNQNILLCCNEHKYYSRYVISIKTNNKKHDRTLPKDYKTLPKDYRPLPKYYNYEQALETYNETIENMKK